MKEEKNDELDYFEVKLEDRHCTEDWVKDNVHEFMCNVYDRIGCAIKHKRDTVKLFKETIDGITLREVSIECSELKKGKWIGKQIKYFEEGEEYEKCDNLVKWLEELNK